MAQSVLSGTPVGLSVPGSVVYSSLNVGAITFPVAGATSVTVYDSRLTPTSTVLIEATPLGANGAVNAGATIATITAKAAGSFTVDVDAAATVAPAFVRYLIAAY